MDCCNSRSVLNGRFHVSVWFWPNQRLRPPRNTDLGSREEEKNRVVDVSLPLWVIWQVYPAEETRQSNMHTHPCTHRSQVPLRVFVCACVRVWIQITATFLERRRGRRCGIQEDYHEHLKTEGKTKNKLRTFPNIMSTIRLLNDSLLLLHMAGATVPLDWFI